MGREKLTFWQKWAVRMLQCGPVPSHIAIIMDGNRRWADMKEYERPEGHRFGYVKLEEALEWCLALGVKTVTLYAFSIENYKRPKSEVDVLMDLAKEKFHKMVDDGSDSMIFKTDCKVKVIGDVTLLPADVREAMAKAVESTKHNEKLTMNVAFSYTSRDEIGQAAEWAVRGVMNGTIQQEDITVDLLEQLLFTAGCPAPDILIRTSGETRLSDFLLWQSSFSKLSFQSVLWPEFSLWNLAWSILQFQYDYNRIENEKRKYRCELDAADRARDQKTAMADGHEPSDHDIRKAKEARLARMARLVEVHREHTDALLRGPSEGTTWPIYGKNAA